MSIFPAGILLSGLVPSAGDRGQADVRLAPHRGYGVRAFHERTLGRDRVGPHFYLSSKNGGKKFHGSQFLDSKVQCRMRKKTSFVSLVSI